jgi:hypothetical protein
VLGDHPDAIALPQTANEFLLEPGELKCGPFDLQHFRHVASDHPADVHPKLRLFAAAARGRLIESHGGLLPCRPKWMRPPATSTTANVA